MFRVLCTFGVGIARFVQGGVVKAFRCIRLIQRDSRSHDLGLRHAFVLWPRSLALVQSLVILASLASLGAVS